MNIIRMSKNISHNTAKSSEMTGSNSGVVSDRHLGQLPHCGKAVLCLKKFLSEGFSSVSTALGLCSSPGGCGGFLFFSRAPLDSVPMSNWS